MTSHLLSLMDLGVDVDALGAVILSAGFIDFDLSLGSTRVSSPVAISLLGVTSPTMNTGGPAMITDMGSHIELVLPIALAFDDILVIHGGVLSPSLLGVVVAPPFVS